MTYCIYLFTIKTFKKSKETYFLVNSIYTGRRYFSVIVNLDALKQECQNFLKYRKTGYR